MSNQEVEPFVNRDTPIPVVSITGPGGQSDAASGIPTPGDKEKGKHHLSPGKLRDKLESLGNELGRPESPSRVSDRLFTMLLQQVLPSQDYDDDSQAPQKVDRRSRQYVDRPGFSLPVMSSNFRRFNARIGVAFVFQNRVIKLFSWRQPTETLSFLAVYTFICLDPNLLVVLPLAGCLFFIMVPAFLARHPPPPAYLPTDLYPLSGPPLAAATTIKPAPELSKDFFRNMRDLQNCMEDFSRVHDALIEFVAPLTNFSNEALSSLLYVILLFTGSLLFITSHLLPWRAIFLTIGWIATCAGHPYIQDQLSSTSTSDLLSEKESESRSFLLSLSKADIELSSSPEIREVEIFELQHRALHNEHGEYEPHTFSPSPYAPLSPARIAGERPKGTPFFEDVKPPRGWRWSDKKWTLDLLSREWVEERCVTGVEVEIEGERWVTDLYYEKVEEESPKRKGKRKEGEVVAALALAGKKLVNATSSRQGEWRRRRWVRGVERAPVGSAD
ncbi:integral peroxisomal membrane peroxin-domain-containing protein [Clohesyomyces aquaticus]|uniref:Integral peroxisomal membrane peroxin-domain-containing protein n=1 Tax=Clohesyomyces aquaticus TaxID=1231657 RepID=A0A1Y1ZSK0_9PLEO|nr:integral peroxisomal membrane peroxin-domain-containing protein [Clohesyomyces aquaticus]